MRNRSYSDEAKHCRDLAGEFDEGSEKPFLLGVAEAFDDLAERNSRKRGIVIGPLGEHLTHEKLPPADTSRWTPRRKAEVVAAVEGRLLSIEEACERYAISQEEFASWKRAVDRNGLAGLRVTRTQQYRNHFGD